MDIDIEIDIDIDIDIDKHFQPLFVSVNFNGDSKTTTKMR